MLVDYGYNHDIIITGSWKGDIISNQKLFTFKYLSSKYNISRPALYKRIKKIHNFRQDHMTKQGNKWLVDKSGAKLITFKKTNSTSNFKSKKIGGYKGYKEKQPTRNDLLKWFESLSTSNKELTKSNARLTAANKMQQNTINQLRNRLNNSQPTTEKLLNKVDSDMKKINLNSHHGWIWKLFH